MEFYIICITNICKTKILLLNFLFLKLNLQIYTQFKFKVVMLQEFKNFILRGNVFDLAVGVIVGGAFGKITTSVINDLLMPPLGLLIGGVNFKDLKLVIGGTTEQPVAVNYGMFIQTTFEFLVIASVIFFAIKAVNLLNKKSEPAAETAPPIEYVVLLTEIRYLLKNNI